MITYNNSILIISYDIIISKVHNHYKFSSCRIRF